MAMFDASASIESRRLVQQIPAELSAHKDFGAGVLGNVRSLATAVAGTEDFACARRRKVRERQLFSIFQGWHHDDAFERELVAFELQALKISPECSKDELHDIINDIRTQGLKTLSEAAITCYLRKWAETHNLAMWSVVMIQFETAPRRILNAHRAPSGGPPQNGSIILRRVDNLRLQAYAPVLDPSDVSLDGYPEACAKYLLRHDPRFMSGGDAMQGHTCVENGTACSSEKARQEVQAEVWREAWSEKADRQAMMEYGRTHNMVVNPASPLAGIGRWDWLLPSDQDDALSRGFKSKQAIAKARAKGKFRNTVAAVNASGVSYPPGGPSVVFTPRSEYFNPMTQPTGAGAWRFFSRDSADTAASKYGGRPDLGFAHTPTPTATQIWNLRLVQGQYAPELNIVWVPEAEDPNGAVVSDQFIRTQLHASLYIKLKMPAGLQNFHELDATMNFTSAHISAWFKCEADDKIKGADSAGTIFPHTVILVMALNDFLGRTSKTEDGRFCHTVRLTVPLPGCKFIFFSDRAWSPQEREQARIAKPELRLINNKADSGWHWDKPLTLIMPILVVQAEGDHAVIPMFADTNQLVLILKPDKVFLVYLWKVIARRYPKGSRPPKHTMQLHVGDAFENIERGNGACFSGPEMLKGMTARLRSIFRASRDVPGGGDGRVGLHTWESVLSELKKGKDSRFMPHKKQKGQ